jgi:hypothetical protein
VNPHLLTVLCLLAALSCYALGLALPATALLVTGGILELMFWVRLLRPGQSRASRQSGPE